MIIWDIFVGEPNNKGTLEYFKNNFSLEFLICEIKNMQLTEESLQKWANDQNQPRLHICVSMLFGYF